MDLMLSPLGLLRTAPLLLVAWRYGLVTRPARARREAAARARRRREFWGDGPPTLDGVWPARGPGPNGPGPKRRTVAEREGRRERPGRQNGRED